jgi:hypothetical protein
MKKLFLFILLLLEAQGMYAQVYTKGAVYDFDIGDEFHYRTSSNSVLNPPSANIDRVLNRYTNNTHLFHEIGDVSLTNATVILSTRIDSIPLSQLSDPIVDTVTSGILGDTITTDSIVTDSILCHQEYISTNSTLDYPLGYEPPSWIKKFVLGLGEVSYYRSAQNGYESKDLVYYKKGATSCGEEVYITSIKNIASNEILRLSPNPFQDQIFITSKSTLEQALQFYLYNNLGQLVLEQTVHGANSIKIPTSKTIPKGIYYGVIHYDNQIQTTKLIRQ